MSVGDMERVSHPVQGNREAVAVFSRQRPCGVPLHVFDPKASAGKALVAVLDDFEQIGWFATCSNPVHAQLRPVPGVGMVKKRTNKRVPIVASKSKAPAATASQSEPAPSSAPVAPEPVTLAGAA